VHITDNQYLEAITIKLSRMHDLKANFDKFLRLTSESLKDVLNADGNVRSYRHMPKMPDSHVMALSLCMEAMGIDSENLFWSKLRSDYSGSFPRLIHLTRFKARRKGLACFTHRMAAHLSGLMSEGEDVFLVDSMPVPVCRNSRAGRSKVCREHHRTAPDKGYSAVNRQYFFGYKLHLVTTVRGVMHSMDITPASVHDVRFLDDVRHSGLNNCTLLADKGYISSECRTDLFTTQGIRLETPMRSNQQGFRRYPMVFARCRKRIETLFSQLCDQMLMKRNYAKSFSGLASRTLYKLAAVTCLQWLNLSSGRPLNHIKHALAA